MVTAVNLAGHSRRPTKGTRVEEDGEAVRGAFFRCSEDPRLQASRDGGERDR